MRILVRAAWHWGQMPRTDACQGPQSGVGSI
jgi:hypothetical protein